MIAVSDATPLIGLATIGRFGLLRRLFGQIYIPAAVYSEVVVAGREIGGAKREVSAATWINHVSVTDQLAVEVLLDQLDRGEAETIVLAKELRADWVLIDERKGRRKATELGLQMVGTVGLLVRAKQLGWLEVLRPELERLRTEGFSLSQRVVDGVLQQVGEMSTER